MAVLPVSEEEIRQLRAAMPQVLESLYGVSDLGQRFCCPSPNHEDKNPSALYWPKDQRVHCFSCGGRWDVFDLIAIHDGIRGFVNQARSVAEIVGISLECDYGSPHLMGIQKFNPEAVSKAQLFDVCCEAFSSLYQPENQHARSYLQARGFDDRDLQRYGFGFTRTPSLIMPQFSVYEPNAEGFIVIPYFADANRNSVAYVTLRTLEGSASCRNKEWRPKGLSVPIWQEWLLTSATRTVCVVEGVFDAVALEKLIGIPCIALGGTAFVGKLAGVLAHCDEAVRPGLIMLVLDNDEAGRKACSELDKQLRGLRVDHCVASDLLGQYKDPNDLLMAGKGSKWEFAEIDPEEDISIPFLETRWH